jgi:calcium-dependent protein kinase
MMGTADFVAPEVLNNSYDNRCDVWSIGCLAHMMLCGSPPFVENSEELVFAAIKKG